MMVTARELAEGTTAERGIVELGTSTGGDSFAGASGSDDGGAGLSLYRRLTRRGCAMSGIMSFHLQPPSEIQTSNIFGFAPKRLRFEPCARGVRTMPSAWASSIRRRRRRLMT